MEKKTKQPPIENTLNGGTMPGNTHQENINNSKVEVQTTKKKKGY